MKNENVPDIDQERHERLCAYVFGELQGAERAAFEAELQRSPELEAERARLVATVSLVKRAVPDEGLSQAVRRDLVASARRSRFRVLRGRSLVRLAAAAVLLLGGVLAVRFLAGSGGLASHRLTERDAKIARVSSPEKQVERTLAPDSALRMRESQGEEAGSLGLLEGLGYVGGGGQSAPVASAPLPSRDDAAMLDALGYGGGGGAQRVEDSPELDALGPAPADSLFAIGPASPGPEAMQVPIVQESISLAKSEGEAPAEVAAATAVGAGESGSSAPAAYASRRAGGGGRGGGGLGQGGGPAGKHRGPGDSKPPLATGPTQHEGAGIPVTAAQESDSRLAAKRIGAPASGTAAGSDGFFLGRPSAFLGRPSAQQGRTPVLTREQVTEQVAQLLDATRVAPGETPRDMFFRYFGDSPFVLAEVERLSTFAVDVDTASYALARSYLSQNQLPPREAVRTEEFVNYFKADQPPPRDGQPFAIGMELAPSLFSSNPGMQMLRVTVRGKDVADFERQPVALTFVIDNSGSMEQGGRLELVKRSLSLLLRQLASGDSVAIVKFSNDAAVVTPMLSAARRGELEGLIQALPIEGGTNVEAGLRTGYELALQSLARNAVNRVVLCSDGVGNIGETSAQGLLALVGDARAKGIYLNTVGVGMGNHDDAFLEELADKGDGVCHYVDSDAEAKRVFVDGLASALQPIARDVKIQVEFDPARVERWRLLGYENRALRAKDFRDDRIDAGEVNAGHQVTALYELVAVAGRPGPLATVRLRYKPPFAIDQGKEGERARAEAEQALEIERTLPAEAVLAGFASATNGYQRAVLVAQFAEVLRQSVHARDDSLPTLLQETRRLELALGDPDFSEFAALLARANPLLDERSKAETPRALELLDELGRLQYELALRGRTRELAVQAGEPARTSDEAEADERAERELRESIERLEGEVRAELFRANGIEPLGVPHELDELGYAGDK